MTLSNNNIPVSITGSGNVNLPATGISKINNTGWLVNYSSVGTAVPTTIHLGITQSGAGHIGNPSNTDRMVLDPNGSLQANASSITGASIASQLSGSIQVMVVPFR